MQGWLALAIIVIGLPVALMILRGLSAKAPKRQQPQTVSVDQAYGRAEACYQPSPQDHYSSDTGITEQPGYQAAPEPIRAATHTPAPLSPEVQAWIDHMNGGPHIVEAKPDNADILLDDVKIMPNKWHREDER